MSPEASFARHLLAARRIGLGAAATAAVLRPGNPVAAIFAGLLSGGLILGLAVAHGRWFLGLLAIEIALASQAAIVLTTARRAWPLVQRIIDWDHVDRATQRQELAANEPSSGSVPRISLRGRLSQRSVFGLAGCLVVGLAIYTVLRVRSESELRGLSAYQQRVQILIKGDVEFQQRVHGALALLEQKAPLRFRFVTQHVRLIVPGALDAANIWVDPPVVLLSNAVHSTPEGCAAALVHEANHIEQAWLNRARHGGEIMVREVLGPDAENTANQAFAGTLRELGAPRYWAEYAESDRGTNWVNLARNMVGSGNLDYWMHSDSTFLPRPLEEAEPRLWKELQILKRSSSQAK